MLLHFITAFVWGFVGLVRCYGVLRAEVENNCYVWHVSKWKHVSWTGTNGWVPSPSARLQSLPEGCIPWKLCKFRPLEFSEHVLSFHIEQQYLLGVVSIPFLRSVKDVRRPRVGDLGLARLS